MRQRLSTPDESRRVSLFSPLEQVLTGFILITGGARSGKSRFAVTLAKRCPQSILYLATASPTDAEMRQRIHRHRRQRPRHWQTVEPPADPIKTLKNLSPTVGAVLLDCLTLYVSELLMRGDSDATIERAIRELCGALRHLTIPVIAVTNEVGLGLVPESPISRRFRDLAGLANQRAAQLADQVILMVAGIPLIIKDSGG